MRYHPTVALPLQRRPIIRLRPKHQLTLPEAVVQELSASVGDRFFVSVDGPGRVVLERVHRSYAGSMPGLWGTPEEVAADLQAMRDDWRET
jgi:hypothetical protein